MQCDMMRCPINPGFSLTFAPLYNTIQYNTKQAKKNKKKPRNRIEHRIELSGKIRLARIHRGSIFDIKYFVPVFLNQRIKLYCIVLYCMVLYCIVLYCILLYSIVFYSILFYSILYNFFDLFY